ncbi:MAG: ABC transporter ATP-binding protein [Candidatus Acidiferrales bacterium]
MSAIAMRAEGLGKQFHIGTLQRKHKNFREAAVDAFLNPVRRVRRLARGHAAGAADLDQTIWALRDVGFEIAHGEVVGIIGRNGAGKSTLLKILSRITEPTLGFVEVHGLMGSLLEVGTGFHQELTGRENIYLNGAILGMRKADIDRQFDEIVAFADVEKFLDTPVKHFSSGMQTRLGFAVAAHLDPEILLVDEVLAVGDANFQRKCLQKMHDVSQQGRTVVFVSHNMQAVVRLCPRVILLDQGQVVRDGPAHEVVSTYLDSGSGCIASREWRDSNCAPGSAMGRLLAVRVRGEDGQVRETFDIRRSVMIEMEYEILKAGHVVIPYHNLENHEGIELFSALDRDPQWRRRPRPVGRYLSTVRIPGNFLNEGLHVVTSGIATLLPQKVEFYVRDAAAFHIVDSPGDDTARSDWSHSLSGVVRPALTWTTTALSNGSQVSTTPLRDSVV